ncbi:MAG: ankyrin repeat domain-containing protein [Chromatiales bacterium]|jgi:ankyrin repeat protein
MKYQLVTMAFAAALLAAGCSEHTDEAAQADVFIAAESGDLPRIDAFISSGANPDLRDACDWTALMKAALNGNTAVVKKLLDAGASVDLLDAGGYSSLMLAASNNHTDSMSLLLAAGADINMQEKTKGWSALIWAAKRGHIDAVRLLLQHGADQQLRDHEHKTALDWALANQHAAVIELLQSGQ